MEKTDAAQWLVDAIVDIEEQARNGAPEGTSLSVCGEDGSVALALVLRPKPPMGFWQSLSAIEALALLEGLTDKGASNLCIVWPDTLAIEGRPLAAIHVRAGYGEGGLFAVVSVSIKRHSADDSEASLTEAHLSSLSSEELVQTLRTALVQGVRVWEEGLATNGAGPLAPVLERYFDHLWLVGQEVDVVYPNGRTKTHGRFAGIDIWGRATIVEPNGEEVEFSPAEASIRG